jgi:gliding motility-associated-like protein
VKFPSDKEGTYTVKLFATNQFGCTDSTSINVIISKGNILFIPNSFTPNSDDINESFKPITEGVVSYYFVIFNRWGEKIFETEDLNSGWDGKHKDEEAQHGSYVYRILIKNKSGEINEVIGHINLLR